MCLIKLWNCEIQSGLHILLTTTQKQCTRSNQWASQCGCPCCGPLWIQCGSKDSSGLHAIFCNSTCEGHFEKCNLNSQAGILFLTMEHKSGPLSFCWSESQVSLHQACSLVNCGCHGNVTKWHAFCCVNEKFFWCKFLCQWVWWNVVVWKKSARNNDCWRS